jgi:NAD+ synthase (glutamine-hydrolysing)
VALRLALAQLNPTVGAVSANTDAVLAAWRAAEDAGADVVAFPELAVTGYPPQDLLLEPEFVAAAVQACDRLAAEAPPSPAGIVGLVDHVEEEQRSRAWDVTVPARDDLRNAAAVIAGGRVLGTYHKARLPTYGVFDEARWFTPGTRPLLFAVDGTNVAVTICEDLWADDGPVDEAARLGAQVVVNINASPYHRGKRSQREHWVRRHAQRHGFWVGYLNAVGGQDGLVFDGDSLVASPDGEVVARGHQFAEDLVVADLDVEPQDSPGLPQVEGAAHKPALPCRDEPERLDPVAEVWNALVLGTYDYCRKNGFERAVVGLSGGIDSSVTAAVAADALGPENLLTVAMPSPFTSRESLEDAEAVASKLGAAYAVIPIEDLMDGFDAALADVFEGLEPDVSEENIQARIRGVLLMAVSNKLGHIVLSTGNKSEAAVGYSTLYGDMVGGFAVLLDVEKRLVYELARHRNGRGEVIPQRVLDKPPSAELRPDQTDEEALGPYEVLDGILRLHIEEAMGVADIVAGGYDEDTVRRVVAMVDRAEYKRRQAAPGVKITERSLSLDRRVPITNAWRR